MLQELKSWCKESKKDIFWTFAGAILSTALGLICQHLIPQTSTQDVGKSADLKGVPEGLQTIIRYLSISDFTNYAIQAVFVIVAIVILILSRRDTIRDLNNKELIVNYMMDNCNVRVYTNDDNEVRYNRIKTTTNLFYGTWLLVWTLWFCYYLGNFIFSFSLEFNYPPYMRDGIKLCETIYSQIFDYLTNTVLLFMYLVLTNMTLRGKDVDVQQNRNQWLAISVVTFLTVCFAVCVVCESGHNQIEGASKTSITSTFLGMYSALMFVLVLGKINSNYMGIPSFMMIMMYIYAIFQCYIPFSDYEPAERALLKFMVPYVTLAGKMAILLSLCWIAYQKRLLLFIIHRSTSIEKMHRLLTDLNREMVDY